MREEISRQLSVERRRGDMASAFTADILKVYRRILIEENQRDLLRIWGKCSEEEPAKIFKLMTGICGTSNAPYLAMLTLNQLATDEKTHFSLASRVFTCGLLC